MGKRKISIRKRDPGIRVPNRNWITGHPLLRQALWIFGALPTLWFVISSMTGVGLYISLKIELVVLVVFGLLFTFMGLVNGLSRLSQRKKEKKINPLCPECFVHIPINFVCRCSPDALLPFVPYFTKGLLYNRCRECGKAFFGKNKKSNSGSLRGKCIACGAVIEKWRFFIFHRSEIVVSMENSLDWHFKIPQKRFKIGSCHEKVPGCQHYVFQQGKTIKHWFRWAPSLKVASISQNLTEKIDSIWIAKECGSSAWQKTDVILNSIRKNIGEIEYGYEGKEDEFHSDSLGILGAEITCDISLEDFLGVITEDQGK